MLTVAGRRSYEEAQLNSLEPRSLTETFLRHPPVGFDSMPVAVEGRTAAAFKADFDILTTLDDQAFWLKSALERTGLSGITRYPTLFSGTTVSEYTSFPAADPAGCKRYLEAMVARADASGAQLLILKDLPLDSPLLPEKANLLSRELCRMCSEDGRFIVVAGQALAYVQIDFDSIEQYLARQSKRRRKDLRKKLRSLAQLEIEVLPTGSFFEDESVLNELYAQYLNVYHQSKYHFDKLTPEFFSEILSDSTNDGVVFMYRKNGALIGYNICFVHEGNLVDKYVGFSYPEARESNLYFVSWFQNLRFALERGLKNYIAGWTDPEVKAYLGASFTHTQHCVYIRNPLLRGVLGRFKRFFENDQNWSDGRERG